MRSWLDKDCCTMRSDTRGERRTTGRGCAKGARRVEVVACGEVRWCDHTSSSFLLLSSSHSLNLNFFFIITKLT